jgi:hypothetical protein
MFTSSSDLLFNTEHRYISQSPSLNTNRTTEEVLAVYACIIRIVATIQNSGYRTLWRGTAAWSGSEKWNRLLRTIEITSIMSLTISSATKEQVQVQLLPIRKRKLQSLTDPSSCSLRLENTQTAPTLFSKTGDSVRRIFQPKLDKNDVSISCQPALLMLDTGDDVHGDNAGVRLGLAAVAAASVNMNVHAGCVVTLRLLLDSSVDNSDDTGILAMVRDSYQSSGGWQVILQQAVTEWKEHPVDTQEDIASAVQRYQELSRLHPNRSHFFGDTDISWWRHYTGRLSLKSLAKFRRMVSPLIVRSMNRQGKCMGWHNLEYSLADLLLASSRTQATTVDLLLRHLVLLQIWNKQIVAGSTNDIRFKYAQLQDLALQTLHRLGGRCIFRQKGLELSHLQMEDLPMPKAGYGNRRSYPNNTTLELLDIRAKRAELQKDFRNDQVYLKHRRQVSGAELFTDQDMTEREFLLETGFMAKVNETLPRPFDVLRSRPRFSRVQLRDSHVEKLKSILFSSDGSLNASCKQDICGTDKHQYIQFSNAASAGQTDKRWQVPIKLHSQKCVQTRSRIESVLINAGVFDPDHETLHDVSLLIGGTCDQSLHHDVPRQMAYWLPNDDSCDDEEAVLGWEANRLAYNSAMASQFAPSSMLIGMNDDGRMAVGVQKDQVKRSKRNSDECQIVNGKPNEDFSIIRENDHLVVLGVGPGVVFTGDFPHAGVRNFSPGSDEDGLMNALNDKIDAILESNPEESSAIPATIDMLCSFGGLRRICRLFCSTELLQTNMTIPRNTIGFTGCYDNLPGGHL